jgi:hypothetical protein
VYRNGRFSWANGSRLYYANLTSNFPGQAGIKGFEAIAVSRIDGPASTGLTQAIVSNQSNWQAPVIVSKQNAALFSDKEQVWADNAESSPFFGNTYICSAAFRGVPGNSQPLVVATSTDGGDSWTTRQITPATNNVNSANGFGRSGCTIRTDSHGVAYVFSYQFANGLPGTGFQLLSTSTDGGRHWTKARPIFPATDLCTAFEPSIGRCVEDGIAGARDDLGPSPSVDIANGAPSGADATNQIVDAWADGRDGLNNEHVMFATSTNGGATWTAPRTIETAGDRGYYAAPAISPNGTDVWVVYNAFTTPFRNDTTSRRRRGRCRGGLQRGPPQPRRGSQRQQPEQPGRGVPGRLRVRGRHPYLRCRGLERRPQGGRLSSHRRLPSGAPRRGGGTRRAGGRPGGATGRGGRRPQREQDPGAGCGRSTRPAGLQWGLRQL